MISWSSQIWFLSPLKFFFYVFVFFSSKVQVRTSFYFLYYYFCSYMCFLSMPLFFVTETWWKWNQVILLYSLSILFLSLKLVVYGNLLSWLFCYYHFFVWVPFEYYNTFLGALSEWYYMTRHHNTGIIPVFDATYQSDNRISTTCYPLHDTLSTCIEGLLIYNMASGCKILL